MDSQSDSPIDPQHPHAPPATPAATSVILPARGPGIRAGANEPEYPTGAAVVPPEALPDSFFSHPDAFPANAAQPSRFQWTLRVAPATYVLLAINIGVFLLMGAAGAGWKDPSSHALLFFGANNAALVLQGQWWRIITAMFVHVGVIHLATNMWCLWNLGLLGEPLLGMYGMAAVYLLTGAAGNLLSTAFNVAAQQYGEVGAGASGAVFGIAGILIVLLSNRRLAEPRKGHPGIPLEELRRLRRSVILFSAINLFIGVGSKVAPYIHVFGGSLPDINIDNLAHLGGVLSGAALGLPLLAEMTRGRRRYLQRQRLTFALSVLVLALFAVWIRKLHG